MSGTTILAVLVVGALAGWLAERVTAGRGLGLIGHVLVGIAGAAAAILILPLIGLGFGGGTGASVVHAAIGSALLLVLIRLARR